MSAEPTFEQRLAAARKIACELRRRSMPIHMADQASAAARDAFRLFLTAAQVEQAATGRFYNNGRPYHVTGDEAAEKTIVLFAGVIACRPCPHLRTGGPQPAAARLAARRLDCQRCVRTVRRPVVPDDRCDLCCELVPDNRFWPLRSQGGALLVVGDVCRGCAKRLRFPEFAGASR